MKECFYCLELIPNSEYVCSHCRCWQPTKLEIDKKYSKVVNSLAITHMGGKSLWKSFWIGAILVIVLQAIFVVLGHQGTVIGDMLLEMWIERIRSSETAILFLIIFCISLMVAYVKSADHIVTNEGYLIEKSLRDRLKNYQTRSFSKNILAIGIIVIVYLLLR